jgi:hypothetical protein
MASRVIELHRFGRPLIDADGRQWGVFALGARRDDDMWIGWLEFVADDGRVVRVTGRETTQPNATALTYWATGLEPVYIEGAFARATEVSTARLPLSA